jgi:hypothetical protein
MNISNERRRYVRGDKLLRKKDHKNGYQKKDDEKLYPKKGDPGRAGCRLDIIYLQSRVCCDGSVESQA